MAKIYHEEECSLKPLEGKKVAVIGYGSQGHAYALNLHESGVDVIVGLYEGSKSWAKAEAAGLKVVTAEQAAKEVLNSGKIPYAIHAYEKVFGKSDVLKRYLE